MQTMMMHETSNAAKDLAPVEAKSKRPSSEDEGIRTPQSDSRLSTAPTDADFFFSAQRVRIDKAARAIESVPRRQYVATPTPIEHLPRLSALLGGPQIYVKRDDLLPLAGGGSKTRKLDYIVQAAIAAGADTLVTSGAVQSNHCRLTASAAAREGLACHIILEERVPGTYDPHAGGNNYSFKLLGASATAVGLGEVPAAEEREMERLRAEGKRPYLIPGGGSNALGAVGYARAALEIAEYAHVHGAFDAIVVCSGSGGTHAGLVAGLAAAGDGTPVHGVSTRAARDAQAAKIHKLALATSELLGTAGAPAEGVIVHDEYVGPGYSLPTDEMAEAVHAFATREGILLDPVYTGKGAAGLFGLVRSGALRTAEKVLFVHTGGAPSLFHYQTLPPTKVGRPAREGPSFKSALVSPEEMVSVYGSAALRG